MAWSDLEMQMATLLALLLKADADATLSVYLLLRRNSPRHEAIRAAANVSLDSRGTEYIRAALKVIQTVEGQRNDLAHASWGHCNLIKDGIVWISGNDAISFHVNANKTIASGKGIDFDKLRDKAFIYRLRDLADIENQIDACIAVVIALKLYTNGFYKNLDASAMTVLCRPLETLAPMKEALRILRGRDAQKICECCSQPLNKRSSKAPP